MDPDTLAKRYLQPMTAEERRIRDLEAKWEKAEREAKEREDAAAKAKEQEHHTAQMRSFVAEITPVECPNLVKLYDAGEVPGLVQRALDLHGAAFVEEYGRHPTNAELRGYLEAEAAKRVQRLTGAEQPALIDGSGHQATDGQKTLTNNHAAQAATQAKPRVETREERLARLAARLEAEEREAAQ